MVTWGSINILYIDRGPRHVRIISATCFVAWTFPSWTWKYVKIQLTYCKLPLSPALVRYLAWGRRSVTFWKKLFSANGKKCKKHGSKCARSRNDLEFCIPLKISFSSIFIWIVATDSFFNTGRFAKFRVNRIFLFHALFRTKKKIFKSF